MGTPHSRVNRFQASAFLNRPEVREFYAILELARGRVAADPAVIDKERCARAMTEAYFRGGLDRERLALEQAAA